MTKHTIVGYNEEQMKILQSYRRTEAELRAEIAELKLIRGTMAETITQQEADLEAARAEYKKVVEWYTADHTEVGKLRDALREQTARTIEMMVERDAARHMYENLALAAAAFEHLVFWCEEDPRRAWDDHVKPELKLPEPPAEAE